MGTAKRRALPGSWRRGMARRRVIPDKAATISLLCGSAAVLLTVTAFGLALVAPPTQAQAYLPSFLSSQSGATLPQRRRPDGSLFTVGDGSTQAREQQYRLQHAPSACEGAPTAWRPMSKQAQIADFRRAKTDSSATVPAAATAVNSRAAQPVLVTSPKDDGASPTALKQYCSKETKIKPVMDLDRGSSMLAQCLREDHVHWCPGDRNSVAAAAQGLRGVQMLSKAPKCMVVNRVTCTKTDAQLNKETGGVLPPARAKKLADLPGLPSVLPPERDLVRHAFKRCAIVGNGPSLAGTQSGLYINRFDAVFRFNSISNRDPMEGRLVEGGAFTTFRVFNRITSLELAEGVYKLKPKPRETWLFWHQNSQLALPAIRKRYPGVTLAMLSPAEISWQLEAYFQLRRDARKLGFGPFSCPSNLNTGVHAILLAQHLCQRVGLFGMSHTMSAALGRFSEDNHTISKFHAWDFDSLLLRMLHFAGRVDVCTA